MEDLSRDVVAERIAVSEREAQGQLESMAADAATREGLGKDVVAVDKRALQPAVALAPAVVLADEPTANLDSARGHEIARLLRRLADE